MILSIFLSITIILVISFCVTSKRIHLFEIFFLWMVIWLLIHNSYSLILINLKGLGFSKDLGDFYTRILKRLVLFPLLIIWFFDISLIFNNKVKKYGLILIAIIMLVLIEYCFIFSGLLIKKNWNVGYSFIQFGFIVSGSYFLWNYYRKKLFKERRSL